MSGLVPPLDCDLTGVRRKSSGYTPPSTDTVRALRVFQHQSDDRLDRAPGDCPSYKVLNLKTPVWCVYQDEAELVDDGSAIGSSLWQSGSRHPCVPTVGKAMPVRDRTGPEAEAGTYWDSTQRWVASPACSMAWGGGAQSHGN